MSPWSLALQAHKGSVQERVSPMLEKLMRWNCAQDREKQRLKRHWGRIWLKHTSQFFRLPIIPCKIGHCNYVVICGLSQNHIQRLQLLQNWYLASKLISSWWRSSSRGSDSGSRRGSGSARGNGSGNGRGSGSGSGSDRGSGSGSCSSALDSFLLLNVVCSNTSVWSFHENGGLW